MDCQHGGGGLCVSCDEGANSCCGEDKDCPNCNNMICYSCYEKHDYACPVCSGNVVTNDDIVDYLLDKYKLQRKDIEDQVKKLRIHGRAEKKLNLIKDFVLYAYNHPSKSKTRFKGVSKDKHQLAVFEPATFDFGIHISAIDLYNLIERKSTGDIKCFRMTDIIKSLKGWLYYESNDEEVATSIEDEQPETNRWTLENRRKYIRENWTITLWTHQEVRAVLKSKGLLPSNIQSNNVLLHEKAKN